MSKRSESVELDQILREWELESENKKRYQLMAQLKSLSRSVRKYWQA